MNTEVAAGEPTEASRYVLCRTWHAVLAIVVAVSLVTQVVLLFSGGPDANSGRADPEAGVAVRLVRLVSYFTIESNMLVLAAAVPLVFRPNWDGRLYRVLRLDALLGIVITGIVYATVLAPQVELTGTAAWVNVGLHYFAPWWGLLGWLLFGPRPRIRWATIAAAFGWPVVWLGYTFVHGAVSGWYPYPFLDAEHLGYAVALRNTAVVVVLAVALAAASKLLDRIPTIRR